MSQGRVLIVVENLPVPFDRRVWLEATTLAQAGYKVSVICPTGKNFDRRFEMIDDIAIYRHPLPLEASGAFGYLLEYGAALFWQSTLALRVAFTRGFDVLHACNPPDLIFLVALPFKLFGKRFLFDQHDLCPEVYEAKFRKQGPFYRLLRMFERATYATADTVIATNESYRHMAITRGGKDPSRVFVVRSGPDLRKWPSSTEPAPQWRNGRRHMIGYVGVMGEQEGLDLLLQAMKLLVTDLGEPDIQLVLVGDGSHRATLEQLSNELGLEGHVTFTGRVSDQELISALGEADVCVNPDRWSTLNDKSTMNKIIEYMAMGKPIVQFDLTEGKVSAGDASLYARPDDVQDMAEKILFLLRDPQLRADMGAKGRQRVKDTLAWEHQVPILLSAYASLF
jgi:glycosyltransferase involved in cell wall biosynthesis